MKISSFASHNFENFDLHATKLKLFAEPKNDLELLTLTQRIVVVDREDAVDDALKLLSGHDLLGLDTESKPQFQAGAPQNRVCLIQLATMKAVVLFRLNCLSWTIPEKLRQLLESDSVIKVGVGISQDLKQLQEYGVTLHGVSDVLTLAKSMDCPKQNLKFLTNVFLGKRMSKAQQLSNWENETLSRAQVMYAACDAWASLAVYVEMTKQKNNLQRWLEAHPKAEIETVKTEKRKQHQSALEALKTLCETPTTKNKNNAKNNAKPPQTITLQFKHSNTSETAHHCIATLTCTNADNGAVLWTLDADANSTTRRDAKFVAAFNLHKKAVRAKRAKPLPPHPSYPAGVALQDMGLSQKQLMELAAVVFKESS